MNTLADQHCRSLEGEEAMSPEQIDAHLAQAHGWALVDGSIEKRFDFDDYHRTMAFVNAVASVAHQEDHHPVLLVSYGSCTVRYDTHSVSGISINDFICAAKVDGVGALTGSLPPGTGLVVAAHGRHVMVETPEGERVLCQTRGKKSELVVGDHARWQTTGDGGVIDALVPRRNLLFRQDDWRSKSFAANLDQLLVLVAPEPVFSESQLTRALVAARQAGIPSLIGLNKVDLPSAPVARARLAPYRAMGTEVIELALKKDPDAARSTLRPLLAGRTTLVLGPSGMGKSTLINLLIPDAAAQVGEISQALNTGRHTTTSTSWYWLDRERTGALIDSPGFQQFGLRQIAPEDLAPLMPDFAAALGHCRFHNCSHRHEPGCGVRDAMERGEISPTRQRIYDELFDELSQKRW